MSTFKIIKRAALSSLLVLLLCTAVSAQSVLVHFLAVGHGDAIFLELPDGRNMLVDGGKTEAGDFVCNYIGDMGFENIDYVVLTHSHEDHIGGLLKVIDRFEIGEVWLCPYLEDTPIVEEFENKIKLNDIRHRNVVRTDRFKISDIEIEVLHPPRGSSLDRLGGPNGASVALRFEYGEISLLLAADIDKAAERNIIEIYGDSIKSTVLKCPHHGSAYSNSIEFLTVVAPEIAIVSAGPSEWGYPDDATIQRIKDNSTEMFRTDIFGTVILEMTNQDVQIINK